MNVNEIIKKSKEASQSIFELAEYIENAAQSDIRNGQKTLKLAEELFFSDNPNGDFEVFFNNFCEEFTTQDLQKYFDDNISAEIFELNTEMAQAIDIINDIKLTIKDCEPLLTQKNLP